VDIPIPAAAAADVLIKDLRFDMGPKFKFVFKCLLRLWKW
jgi:hypothetical protein